MAKSCKTRKLQKRLISLIWPALSIEMHQAWERWCSPSAHDPDPHIQQWAQSPCRPVVLERWKPDWPYGDESKAKRWAEDRCLWLLEDKRNSCNAEAKWHDAKSFRKQFRWECELYVALNLAHGPAKVWRRFAGRVVLDALYAEMVRIIKSSEKKFTIGTGSFGTKLVTHEWVRKYFQYLSRKETFNNEPTNWYHAGAFLRQFTTTINQRVLTLLSSVRGRERDLLSGAGDRFEAINSTAHTGSDNCQSEAAENEAEKFATVHRKLQVVRVAAGYLPEPLPRIFTAAHRMKLTNRAIAYEVGVQPWSVPFLLKQIEIVLRHVMETDRRIARPAPHEAPLPVNNNLPDELTIKEQQWMVCTAEYARLLIEIPRINAAEKGAEVLNEFQSRLKDLS